MWPGGVLAPKCQLLNPYPCIFGVMAVTQEKGSVSLFPFILFNIYYIIDIMWFNDQITNTILGFVLGIVAALMTYVLLKRHEHQKKIKNVQFNVYMKLLELNSLYFWVASNEIHKNDIDEDLRHKIRDLAWQIADLLRLEDKVPYIDKILHVLMSLEYESAIARHDKMGQIIKELGSRTNPKYQEAVKIISRNNVILTGTGQRSTYKSTTPSFM